MAALYLRSRQTTYAVVALAVAELVTWAVAWWLTSRPKFELAHLDLVIGFAALAAACVVGASVRAPFGENESLSARYLAPFRLGHLAGLLGLASALLFLISLGWERQDVASLLIRNLLGLSGMSFLAAYVIEHFSQ